MKLILTLLFFMATINTFAAETKATPDMEGLVSSIDHKIEKMSLKDQEMFSRLVRVVQNDIVAFSKSTGSDPKQNMLDLFELFEQRLRDTIPTPACTNVPELNEECSSLLLKHFRSRVAVSTLQLIISRYIKLEPMTNKGERTTLP